MNDKIVNALVEAYKQKDVSLEALINDPLFRAMPPERQVEAIQGYAGILSVGGKAPKAHKILARIAGQGAVYGAMSFGLPASMSRLPLSEKFGLTGLGAVIGMSLGGLSGAYEYYKDKKSFDQIQKGLKTVQRTGNMTDAVKVLTTRRQTAGNPYLGKILDAPRAVEMSGQRVFYGVKKDFPEAF
jgi:hypothetical protein